MNAIKRQAREIVSGQEAFGCQVAIGVELGADSFAAGEQRGDLLLRAVLKASGAAPQFRIA